MRSFVDTNVLVYAVDTSEPEKRHTASVLLEARADELVLSAQVLSEFYTVATRRLAEPLSEAEATAFVDDLGRLPIVALDFDVVRDGIRVSREARLSYWDGLIVAAARRARCDVVLTEDLSHGTTVAGVRIENPFPTLRDTASLRRLVEAARDLRARQPETPNSMPWASGSSFVKLTVAVCRRM